jgi:predicted RNA polymerase sigma factor
MQLTATSRTGARRSHTEALAERLYAAHRSHLLAIARRNSDDPGEAEEALHDAFILFIERFDPATGAPPLAWLTLYADFCVMPTLGRKAACQAEIGRMRPA